MNQTLDSTIKSGSAPVVRKAHVEDAGSIHDVIERYQFRSDKTGQLIPLNISEITALIATGTFYVAEADKKVVGCSSLIEYDGLAELRSWAVLPGYQGRNIGAELALAVIDEAKARGHAQIHTLTQTQNFSLVAKLGFVKTERPVEKLLKDCASCPIYDSCNETAFVRTLQPLQPVQLKP